MGVSLVLELQIAVAPHMIVQLSVVEAEVPLLSVEGVRRTVVEPVCWVVVVACEIGWCVDQSESLMVKR